jgi:hypothetical protein
VDLRSGLDVVEKTKFLILQFGRPAHSPSLYRLCYLGSIKINIEILIGASKEVGLEVNAENSKYVLLSRHHYIKIASRCFENCGTVQIFGNDSNI